MLELSFKSNKGKIMIVKTTKQKQGYPNKKTKK